MRHLIFVILILFFSSNAFAYRCGQPRTIEEEYDYSSAIFLGKVVSATPISNGIKDFIVTFEVESIWKGDTTKTVQVYVDDLEAKLCGTPFKVGEKYLVYAKGQDHFEIDTCQRGVTACTRTNSAEVLKDDIQELERRKVQP